MEGSPNLGYSSNRADLITEAPAYGFCRDNIQVFNFDEYFESFKDSISIAIRSQWIGQSSDSEHNRALGLAIKTGHSPWVYTSISGKPRISKKTGIRWRSEVPIPDRRTVYMLFVEKNKPRT